MSARLFFDSLNLHPVARSIIAFRFIPNSVVTRPVEAVWNPLIQEPWYKLSYNIRLAIGWLCLLGIIFGSAFGFPLEDVSVSNQR